MAQGIEAIPFHFAGTVFIALLSSGPSTAPVGEDTGWQHHCSYPSSDGHQVPDD